MLTTTRLRSTKNLVGWYRCWYQHFKMTASDAALDYFLRFQSTVEEAIGASVDEALAGQPENPILAITVALCKRCSTANPTELWLLKASVSVLEAKAKAAAVPSLGSQPSRGTETCIAMVEQRVEDAIGQLSDHQGPFQAIDRIRELCEAVEHFGDLEGATDGSERAESEPSSPVDSSKDPLGEAVDHGEAALDPLGETCSSNASAPRRARRRRGSILEDARHHSYDQLMRPNYHAYKDRALSELRVWLRRAQQLVTTTQDAIDGLLPVAHPVTRASYLVSITDKIGPPPLERLWQDEWVALKVESLLLSQQFEFANQEYAPPPRPVLAARPRPLPAALLARHRLAGPDARLSVAPLRTPLRRYVLEHCNVDQEAEHFAEYIEKLVERGWRRQDATTYRLLSTVGGAIGRAFREGDTCYAASTYALRNALVNAMRVNRKRRLRSLSSRVSIASMDSESGAEGADGADGADGTDGTDSGVGAAQTVSEVPPPFYWHRSGRFSLTESEEAWRHLEIADRNGFCGLSCSTLVRASREASCFNEDGMLVKVNYGGQIEYESVQSDVICFESNSSTWQFGHSVIYDDSEERGAFPPSTLFRLKQTYAPGEWVAPGGSRPKQKLLVVTATYNANWNDGGGHDDDEHPICGKMWSEVVTLSYGRREAYITGLEHLWAKPVLTMQSEFDREYTWTDWQDAEYSLRNEFAYVNQPAVRKEGCTPGTRDDLNHGKEPLQFLADANEHIRQRRASGLGTRLPAEYAELTFDEMLAVRVYSGPAFQPINEFLRNVSKLSDELRAEMAKHPALTFAATVGHLCRAVRKLAAVATDEEARRPLWRNVRGELPRSFWTPDEQGLVCATDLAFFSTSRDEAQPLAYMQEGGKNVLWELEAQPENDTGYHVGADVELLSQFAHEKEVLFPPCTLLKVHPRKSRAASTPAPEEATAGAVAPGAAVPEAASTDTAPLRPFRSASGPAAPGTDPAPRDRFSLSRSKTLEPFHADEVTRVDPKNPSRVFEVLKVKVLPEFL